jgi:hypothetical protein
MLAAERDDAPLFGFAGEMMTGRPEPAPPAPQPFVIEPPDWSEEERLRRKRDAVEPEPKPPLADAVLAMVAADADEPRPPGPPVHNEPLVRAIFPEPDWRNEEQERARQEAREKTAATTLDELEPEEPAYPVPKRKTAKSTTPNLDAVRAGQQA